MGKLRGWTSCISLGWFFFFCFPHLPRSLWGDLGRFFQVQVWASSILQSYFKTLINDDAAPEPKQQQDVPVLIFIDDQCLSSSGSVGVCFNKWLHFHIYFGNPRAALGVKGCKGDFPFKSDLSICAIEKSTIIIYTYIFIYTHTCRTFSALSRHIPMSYIEKPENGTGRSHGRSLSSPTQKQSCRYPCIPDRGWHLIPPLKENPKHILNISSSGEGIGIPVVS